MTTRDTESTLLAHSAPHGIAQVVMMACMLPWLVPLLHAMGSCWLQAAAEEPGDRVKSDQRGQAAEGGLTPFKILIGSWRRKKVH